MMNINDIVYIHIPKTGGWGVGKMLKEIGYTNFANHNFAKNVNLTDKFVFTIVRNPWERLVSTYTFLTSGSELPGRKGVFRPFETRQFSRLGIKSFEGFIDYLYNQNKDTGDCYILANDKKARINLFTLNQVNWILDDSGELLVNHICSLTDMEKCIAEVKELTGIENIFLPAKSNTTNHIHYKELYNERTIKMVSELYDKDITYFNFKFDD